MTSSIATQKQREPHRNNRLSRHVHVYGSNLIQGLHLPRCYHTQGKYSQGVPHVHKCD